MDMLFYDNDKAVLLNNFFQSQTFLDDSDLFLNPKVRDISDSRSLQASDVLV